MSSAKYLKLKCLQKTQAYPAGTSSIFGSHFNSKSWCLSLHRIAQFRYYITLVFSILLWDNICFSAVSDTTKSKKKEYYMFPIRPNKINSLAGTMGELRRVHFHAGIDIRTLKKVGLQVYAAADGYISRVSVDTRGYGKALYITHPNGETTLYAHLLSFKGEIAKYVKNKQYENNNFFLNEYFTEEKFIIKKGQIIALSGNTGSSRGPHLHFEIRDSNQHALNPLEYGFDEIKDSTPPVLRSLGVIPKHIESRVNGVFDRINYKIYKKNNILYVKDTIFIHGKVGLELFAYDLLDGSGFRCGINTIKLKLGDRVIFSQHIDTIVFSEKRNILTQYNYQEHYRTGNKYHKLYIDEGNTLPYYKSSTAKGLIVLAEDTTVQAYITASDTYGNKSILKFFLSSKPPPTVKKPQSCSQEKLKVIGKTLIVKSSYYPTDHFYQCNNSKYALYNMNSLGVKCRSYTVYDDATAIHPNRKTVHSRNRTKIIFSEQSLFDTLYLNITYRVTKDSLEVFTIGDPSRDVLKGAISVELTPSLAYEDSSKVDAYRKTKQGWHINTGGEWKGNTYFFKTYRLGDYVLLKDDKPPKISPLRIRSSKVILRIRDNLSGIKTFDAYINDEWLLMEYDHKSAVLWTTLEKGQKLSGKLKVIVTDRAGNEKIFETKIQ